MELKSPRVTNQVKALAQGPNFVARRYNGYIIKGIRFHTKEIEGNRKTQNSGVMVIAKTSSLGDEVLYYGVLNDIIELNYYENFRVMLFKCHWVNVEKGKGMKKDSLGFTLVNLSKLIHTGVNINDEPFIFASQAQQVFYIQDALQLDWHVVIRIKPRDLYEMGDEMLFESNCLHSFTDDGDMGQNTQEIEENWARNDIEGITIDSKVDEKKEDELLDEE